MRRTISSGLLLILICISSYTTSATAQTAPTIVIYECILKLFAGQEVKHGISEMLPYQVFTAKGEDQEAVLKELHNEVDKAMNQSVHARFEVQTYCSATEFNLI